MLTDPTGMDAEEPQVYSESYTWQGADARAAFRVLQTGRQGRKNAYILFTKDMDLRKGTNRQAEGGVFYGQWAVWAVSGFQEAAFLLQYVKDKSFTNLVVETHGGIYESMNFIMAEAPVEHQNAINFSYTIFTDQITTFIQTPSSANQSIAALKTLGDKVADEGNLIISACLAINGSKGEKLLEQLWELNNRRISVVGSQNYSRISLGLKGLPKSYGFGLDGSISDHKTGFKPSWKQKMFSSGAIIQYNDIILHVPWGKQAVEFKK